MIKYNFVLILSLLVIITGCKKDIDELDVTTEVTNPVEGTNSRIANFNGLVSGLDGAPILNANVEVNGDGGTIETNDGAKVTFGSNTIIDSNGNLYNGSVSVYAHWYDPTSEDLSLTMPGDLRATDALGNEVQLATFGMLAVELETPDGQPLNISEGNTAELTFPLEELADGAPNEIPLWYLDEESGIWKEEGQATKVGNTYVGEVSHFSFWNCDGLR